MYESYTRQALPSKRYRELLGTAICVFNSNNAFVIENVLRYDQAHTFTWYQLTDWESGVLKERAKSIINEKLGKEIYNLFEQVIDRRNRIIHSFQVTNSNNEQILRTKTRAKDKDGNRQSEITESYLLEFIQMNNQLSDMLHCVRR